MNDPEDLMKIAEIGARSRTRLGLIAGRLSRKLNVDRDLVVTALLGQHPEAFRPEFDLPAVHYERKNTLLDQLGCCLLLDWTSIDWPDVRGLDTNRIHGHLTADIILACKTFREGACDFICRQRENFHEILRIMEIESTGNCWNYLAPWYAREIQKRLDVELHFFEALR